MHLVPHPRQAPSNRAYAEPRDGEFFYKLFKNCYQYLDAARYAQGVVAVPRFSNGDLLLVRLPRKLSQGFSVEFPFGSARASSSPQATALASLAREPDFDWSVRSVLRLGAVDSPKLSSTLDVFLIAVPDGAVPDATDSEAVNHPLRISDLEFKGMVERGEVVDGTTLAAYALLLTRQALQKSGGVVPLLDRRRPRNLQLVKS